MVLSMPSCPLFFVRDAKVVATCIQLFTSIIKVDFLTFVGVGFASLHYIMHFQSHFFHLLHPIVAKCTREFFLSINPNSGQIRPHLASAIYRNCCIVLDLELVITCNRKSNEA